jgi:ABC-type protease/lipase transport system fused ATPase/permease subunit
MSSAKQRSAARKNIKKAASAAKKKKTIAHLSRGTRTALGKQGAKMAAKTRRSQS